jgi:hypothetical protein
MRALRNSRILLPLTWLAFVLALAVSVDVVEDLFFEELEIEAGEGAATTSEDESVFADIMMPSARVARSLGTSSSDMSATLGIDVPSSGCLAALTPSVHADIRSSPIWPPPFSAISFSPLRI